MVAVLYVSPSLSLCLCSSSNKMKPTMENLHFHFHSMHKVAPSSLAKLAKLIPKIAIISGDRDEIIPLSQSWNLHQMLPGSDFKMCKGVGHGLTLQISEEFNNWLRNVIEEGAALGEERIDGSVRIEEGEKDTIG